MKNLLQSRVSAFLLLLLPFLLIYGHVTKFPYTFCIIIIYIFIITYWQYGNLKILNFKKIRWKEFKIIIGIFLLFSLFDFFLLSPAIDWIFRESADYSVFHELQGNTPLYLKKIFNMWISAAFGEELLFRAFAFTQLEHTLKKKTKWIVPITALLFCIPHAYQGISGVVGIFITGIILAIIYNKTQNIWINVAIHGLIDTLSLTLLYLGILQ
ncbi:CPBP family intramembrane glutamic endopeptidase [Chryseobacterium sp.]|uniref:CPBP family intramembrane glutamic endopeptidase n=1 Tax=Chryseobacterium sp. TaxID=1871047 RepID=UPI0025BB94E4|nr:CPBP family intramembrane glutamic endopeptidase [Chryseobacterium sp.]MBV8325183.1 CPBP family intramembrane metalloprotease [Chryseobacterium sp.]